jgi:hypothetical protein
MGMDVVPVLVDGAFPKGHAGVDAITVLKEQCLGHNQPVCDDRAHRLLNHVTLLRDTKSYLALEQGHSCLLLVTVSRFDSLEHISPKNKGAEVSLGAFKMRLGC